MSRLRTLLSDTLAMTGTILVAFLAVGLWLLLLAGVVWLILAGLWFVGIPFLALAIALFIVVMDEYA